MRGVRIIAVGIIAAVIALGIVVEQDERMVETARSPVTLSTPRADAGTWFCLLYTSPSPRDVEESRMPSSA